MSVKVFLTTFLIIKLTNKTIFKVLILATKSPVNLAKNVKQTNKVELVAVVLIFVNQSFVRFVLPIEKLIKTYVR